MIVFRFVFFLGVCPASSHVFCGLQKKTMAVFPGTAWRVGPPNLWTEKIGSLISVEVFWYKHKTKWSLKTPP